MSEAGRWMGCRGAARWPRVRVSGRRCRHGQARRPPARGPRRGARPGDVVLARFPARPELLVVKRAGAGGARRVVGGGRQPLVTDDSRAFGRPVVVGRVLLRLARAGEVAQITSLSRVGGAGLPYASGPMGSTESVMTATNDRFADDPAFAVHEGGKLSVRTRAPSRRSPTSPSPTPGCGPRVQRHRRRARARPPVHLGPRVVASSPTAPPCWAWVTSARPPRCRSWRARPACSASSPSWTPCRSCCRPPTSTRSWRPCWPSRPRSAASTSRISAPRCFEVEARLKEQLHIRSCTTTSTAPRIVVLAALRNAAKVTGRQLADLRVVVSGAGAAGVACTKILLEAAWARSPSPTRRACCTPAARG